MVNPSFSRDILGMKTNSKIVGKTPMDINPKYLVKKMCFKEASSKLLLSKNFFLIFSDLDTNQYNEKNINVRIMGKQIFKSELDNCQFKLE
jgi:hypothetical protein